MPFSMDFLLSHVTQDSEEIWRCRSRYASAKNIVLTDVDLRVLKCMNEILYRTNCLPQVFFWPSENGYSHTGRWNVPKPRPIQWVCDSIRSIRCSFHALSSVFLPFGLPGLSVNTRVLGVFGGGFWALSLHEHFLKDMLFKESREWQICYVGWQHRSSLHRGSTSPGQQRRAKLFQNSSVCEGKSPCLLSPVSLKRLVSFTRAVEMCCWIDVPELPGFCRRICCSGKEASGHFGWLWRCWDGGWWQPSAPTDDFALHHDQVTQVFPNSRNWKRALHVCVREGVLAVWVKMSQFWDVECPSWLCELDLCSTAVVYSTGKNQGMDLSGDFKYNWFSPGFLLNIEKIK